MSTAELTDEITIGPESAGLLMTPEEFDAIEDYDECYIYELIRGVLVVTEFPAPPESAANERLGYLIWTYMKNHPQGADVDTVYGQYIPTHDSRCRTARVVWVELDRSKKLDANVPKIAVDFVSAGKRAWIRDYLHRRDEYMQVGVSEYWLFDRFRNTLAVFFKSESGIGEQFLGADDVYTTDLLPGFDLPVGDVLSEANKDRPNNKCRLSLRERTRPFAERKATIRQAFFEQS